MGLGSERRRKYGSVTEKRSDEVTAPTNNHLSKLQTDPMDLMKRRTDAPVNRRAATGRQDASSIGELLSIWPKIVEYAGLSEYEAKVYLCLVGLGSSGARKLSLFCDVPRTKVYGTLKKLIDYGLVVEIPGSPKRFVPSSPDDAFRAILNIVRNKAMDFTSVVRTLVETHESMKEDSFPQKKIVWYLNNDSDIIRNCKEIIGKSKETVTILANDDGLSLLFNFTHRLLDELRDKGVEVKLYSPLDPKTNPLARELSYLFDVKKVEVVTPMLFIDSDHRQFLLAKIAERGDNKHLESAIFSDDPTLLQMISLLLKDEKRQALMKTLFL